MGGQQPAILALAENRQVAQDVAAYKRLELIQLVFAASIPILSIVQVTWWRWVTAVLGGLIVVLEGAQQLWQFNNLWITYCSTADQLKHKKFWTCVGSVDCLRLRTVRGKGEQCHEQTRHTHRSFAEKLSGWSGLPTRSIPSPGSPVRSVSPIAP